MCSLKIEMSNLRDGYEGIKKEKKMGVEIKNHFIPKRKVVAVDLRYRPNLVEGLLIVKIEKVLSFTTP